MPKTALDLTPEEWQTYQPAKPFARNDADERLLSEREDQAWQVAHILAEHLREKFNATRVVVFGSLAHRAWFNTHSDIDLAAWGIPADKFYRAVAFVTGLSPDFEIDLVDPHNCRSSIQQAIALEGCDV